MLRAQIKFSTETYNYTKTYGDIKMDFSKLKSQSGKNSLEKLTQELSKMNQQYDSKDDRFWYPNVDKAGNGYAVIRFLPAPGDEEVPFIRIWEHGFKGPTGSWYIENSLTSIGKPDPVSELNSKLWNMSSDDESPTRKQARAQKRKLNYICNVYIIEDQANPENKGKVFLFKFGKKIFDKLNEAMHPQYPGEEAMNPFDMWSGADFKLKIRNVDGYRNYDKSEFTATTPFFEDDEKKENIWRQEHSLQAFLDESNFKTYEELQAKLNKVLNLNGEHSPVDPATARAAKAASNTDLDDEIPWKGEVNLPAASAKGSASSEDEDDDLAFFTKLASQ
jgi:hypothetical protein